MSLRGCGPAVCPWCRCRVYNRFAHAPSLLILLPSMQLLALSLFSFDQVNPLCDQFNRFERFE